MNSPVNKAVPSLSSIGITSAASKIISYYSIIMAFIILALIVAYSISITLADESSLLQQQHQQQNGDVQYVYAAYTKATPAAGGPALKDPSLKVEKIFQDDLGVTTSMAFLGPNDILILEKNEGKVHRIKDGILLPEPVLTVSNIGKEIEWGMLGIAVDKVTSDNANTNLNNPNGPHTYVFLYYTEPASSSTISNNSPQSESEVADEEGQQQEAVQQKMTNRLYRYELVSDKLINPKLLLSLPLIRLILILRTIMMVVRLS